jgi:putative redox protein
MKVQLSATPDFKFTARNDTGYTFDIGASKAIGGDESGFRPMQLMLAALGSCAGIDAINILKKSRVEFSKLDVEIAGQRKENAMPAPFTHVHMKFMIHGKDADLAKSEKAVSLSIEKYCSVAASLDPNITVTHSTHIMP